MPLKAAFRSVLLAGVVLFAWRDGALAAAASSAVEPSFIAGTVSWIFEQQRAFHRELTEDLRTLAGDGGSAAALALISASFLYGVFHAAGPGHGKAVLTTYLLTQKERAVRGIILAAGSALCQGVTALVLVYGLVWLAGWLPRDTSAAITWSERISFALVTLIGAVLAIRAIRSMARKLRSAAPAGRDHDAGGHTHDHGHADASHAESHCGHSHGPSTGQLENATSIRASLALILSIGLRPCSGAVLVLILANALGRAWAGVFAVLAMSAGTALAVAALALLAVYARSWASSIATAKTRRFRYVGDVVAFGGGLAVMLVGVWLVAATFAPPHPLGVR